MKISLNKKAEGSGTGLQLQTLLGLVLSAFALIFLIWLSAKVFESYTQSELDVYTMLSADRLVKNIELVKKENIEINDIISTVPNFKIYICDDTGIVIAQKIIKNSVVITEREVLGKTKEKIFKILPIDGKIKTFFDGKESTGDGIVMDLSTNTGITKSTPLLKIFDYNYHYNINIKKNNEYIEIKVYKKPNRQSASTNNPVTPYQPTLHTDPSISEMLPGAKNDIKKNDIKK